MKLAALVMVCTVKVAAASCGNITGLYVDGSGNIATLTESAGGSLFAQSLSNSGWTTAVGGMSSPSSCWMVFNAANLTGSLSDECNTISWSNGATWVLTEPDSNVTTVHAVFMTHLDVGFTLLARDVCEEYFFRHFPNGAS
jgi:hypothetical protein